MSSIGARLPRKEDPRLLRGRGRFGDDISVPGQLWARVVRSPSAHGEVNELDVTQAAKAPGIAAVVTAADLPPGLVIPVRLAVPGPDLSAYLQPVLAATTVRYVGEPLAVVVGDDPYACEDAAELVEIDIAERPAVLDARTADSPAAAELSRGYGAVEAAFAQARHVVRIELAIGRHSGVPLEPRCLLAVPDGDRGSLDIFGMTKVPVFNRDLLARLLGLDETLIHVHGVDAGGGFGVRGEFYPEDFLIPWLALTMGRPVKWSEDRAEHLVAVNHSRQQYHRIAAAFDGDGRILALGDDVTHDNGAYCRTHGVAVPELTVAMLPGPYRVPAYRGRIRVVLTNKTPCGTYRAPGRFEGTAAREHLLDVAADQLGLDRVELRRRNLLTRDEIPHHRPIATLGTDLILDTGDYPALLAALLSEVDRLGYRALDPKTSENAEITHVRHGFGLALFVEKSGLGPQETADVTVSKSGAVHVYCGGTSIGQGIETVLAQIAADALGVDPGVVSVTTGDTAAQPFGAGSWASRSTVVGGSAVHLAAAAVRKRAIQLAARILEVDIADVEVRDGAVAVRGDPGARVSLGEIAQAAAPDSRFVEPGEPAGLSARRRFEVSHMTYPYGAHAAVVAVDPGTGQVRVLRYLVAYEVGRAVNPMLVEGQLRGGVAQGIGGALFEEFSYDDAGQPQAITFIEYRMPTAAEVPPVDLLVCQDAPSPGNPLGVMGAGEGGVSAAGAAVANAVRDALGLAGGVGQLPLTPARVRELWEARHDR
ncbi:MAG TPA: xanthine dehydrogenase family protein molybdopterin-binding subunit [Streptosporangiaceae bacterium]|nr:xanthine dehydrogenase family protein molybdopterin-binding subunit [Streptosporangiaceae bacterium]